MLQKSIFLIIFILMASCLINAQVPQLINYQGVLTDAAGNKINGNRSIQFSIYDLPSGGTPIWYETQPVVTITDGLFNVLLGSVTPIPYSKFNGTDKYLALKVGTDPEMTPRKRLVSVGYSFRAYDTDKVDGKDAAAFVQKVDGVSPGSDGNIDLVAGTNVAISPNNANNTISISATPGVLSLPYSGTSSDAATAFSIANTGMGGGIKASVIGGFDMQGNPIRTVSVYGEATSKADKVTNFGGYFISWGGDGKGVYGGSGGINGCGVYGEANGSNSNAVVGVNTGGGNAGLFKIDNASNRNNAVTISTNGSGTTIWAGAYGTGTAGYFGIGNPNNNSPALRAVGNGVAGSFKAQSNTGVGIFAEGGANGYAAEFKGNVIVRNRSTGANIIELGEGLDYAEGFNISDQTNIEPGTVLVIDPDNHGKLTVSMAAYDRKVAGIVAGAKGVGSGVRLCPEQFDYDVALAGRVYCNVDATHGEVNAGDLLTTSATPGYAMVVKDYSRAQGAILGKAMESLAAGEKKQILVLVTLQ